MTAEENLFVNGKRIDTENIRRGCKTTDVHAFIQNDLFRFLTEIQVNYEADTKKPMMRSRLINLAIIDLIENLKDKSDREKIHYIQDLNQVYKEHYN